jgi:AraC-like DNA-binding protein
MVELKRIGIDLDVNRVIEAHRRSFEESENDILRRLLLADATEVDATNGLSLVTDLDVASFGMRNRGFWQVAWDSKVVGATSLKDAYCQLLVMANTAVPNLLDRLASERARSRRYVARQPGDLYLSSPHLAKDHAIEVVPGWFVDLNLSEAQVAKRARVAARLAGLAYGSAVWIRNSGRTI